MSQRPNILLVLADGVQRAPLDRDHPCFTPTFDRLAREGVQCTNAYTPSPTCSPARASLMTGVMPHNHGVLQVEHCVDEDQCILRTDLRHWAQDLEEAGYRTGFVGKWHVERSHHLQDFGWQYNRDNHTPEYAAVAARKVRLPGADNLDPGTTRYYADADGYLERLHYGVTDLSPDERDVSIPVELARPFLADALGEDDPWCCCVSFAQPNDELVCSRETFERYDVNAIEPPANVDDEPGVGIYRRVRGIWGDMSHRDWQMARTCYYARITEIDGQVAALIEQVAAAGQLDNTIVIVSSDHGRYVGGHGMDGHNYGAYEEIYNIPLIARGPGIAEGVVTGARVGLHELCPTLLELAGLEPFDVPDSRSFASVVSDPRAREGKFVTGYGEYFGSRFMLTQRVLWDGPWKLVFNGFDFDELYNLDEDPHETCNLAGVPEYAQRYRAMMAETWRRIRDTDDQSLLNSHWCALRIGVVGPNVIEEGGSNRHPEVTPDGGFAAQRKRG